MPGVALAKPLPGLFHLILPPSQCGRASYLHIRIVEGTVALQQYKHADLSFATGIMI